ncbi:MAG: hypothetical protein IPN86_12420 [Saprospiraceae bacterium]|nr:hypothetical protein [Saprospiraceae bacterium]
MVENASGINLWSEWARIECAACRGQKYKLPKVRTDHGGIIVSLSRYEHPDTSSFEDKEIVWRMKKSTTSVSFTIQTEIKSDFLLDKYAERVQNEFHECTSQRKVGG